MSNYELDENNYLHDTTCGWYTTVRPLTQKEIEQVKNNTFDYNSIEWE